MQLIFFCGCHRSFFCQTNLLSSRPTLNFGDARAPAHTESDGITPLVPQKGSRLSKGTLASGYKATKSRQKFFAPTETPSQATPAQAAPRPQKPAGAASGQQPPAAAKAAQRRPTPTAAPRQQPPEAAAREPQWRPTPTAAPRQQPPEAVAREPQRGPPQAVAPRQHGIAAAFAWMDAPSAGPTGRTSRSLVPPLPPVDAFNTPRNSRIRWHSPVRSFEELNGRRKLPKASELPKRSALAGGRAGKLVPDTRAFCAQTGISGNFSRKNEDREEEESGVDGEVEAETMQLSPDEAIAPARGSLLRHVPVPGPAYDGFADSDPSPQAAAAPAASATPRMATSLPPGRTESPGLQATELAREDGDEEQGRELMMTFITGNPEDDERELTTNSVAGAAAADEDDGELGGDEEQGRELMMRIATGRDTPPPAVSPAEEEEEDETVPPSPHSAAESDNDGSSNLGSDEDEDHAVLSLADEPPPPVQTVQWRRPKLASAPAGGGGGSGGRGDGGGGGNRTISTKAPSPGRSTTAPAIVVHKPVLTLRSSTRFSASVAVPSVPSNTGPLPSSFERPPQLPINNDAHQSFPDAHAMPAPPNAALPPGGPARQVVWKTPRQTSAPAAITPTSSLDRQQEEQSEDQRGEDSPCELELPSEVVDALNPQAVRVLSTDVPSTSWRQPARSDRGVSRLGRHQAQRHVVSPAASTSPPSSASSSAASSPPSGERAQPGGRGSRPLAPFGAYPFRPQDERDSIPQSQLTTLSSKATRLTASNAAVASRTGAAVLPRQQQRDANAIPEVNGVPLDGQARGEERGRPVMERRSTSSSSGPTSRESSSRSSSRSTNPPRQRRRHYTAGEEFRRNPRDGHGRGSEGRGRGDPSLSRNSSRTGPGGRMVGYHDRRDRPDCFGRDARDERGSGGFGNNRGARDWDFRQGGRGGDGYSSGYRGRRPEKEGRRGDFGNRRSEHNDNRSSRSRHWRDRSRSPQR